MSDVETLLTRSLADAVAGVELDPTLIDTARHGIAGRRRRRRLQAGATVGLLVAALVAGAIVLALGPSGPQGVQIGNRRANQSSEVTVPTRAAHTDIIDAYNLLHRLGFRVELTQQMSISTLIVPGVTLTPAAGTRVPRGSIIQITPSFAAIGSPAVEKSNPHYLVPNFVGDPLTDAVRWANQHEMFWSIPKLPALPASAAPHLFDAYRIIDQQPKAHDTIVQGVRVGDGFRPTPLTLTVVPNPAQ